jgi:predicted Zn-dependent protease
MSPFVPMARCALMALALLSASVGAAMAKTVPVVPGQVIGQVEVPDSWTVNRTPRGIEIASPDEEVMIWMEVFRRDQGEAVMREHERYFQEQGVRITGPDTMQDSVTNGIRARVQSYPATWKGKPTILAYQTYGAETEPSRFLMITYWASPEGDRRYAAQVRSVVSTTNFTLR